MASIGMIPSRASATEYQGTSPSFATDTEWATSAFWCNAGDLIEWDWTTSDTLSFSLLYTSGTSTTHVYGFSSYDGYVVPSAGHYALDWYNNNLFFSAMVSYWVAAFTPSLAISSPADGAYLSSRLISLQGSTDPYTDGVLVGPDAMHLREATWSGDNWGVDNLAMNEGQNSILVRSYYLLDYYGYENTTYDRTIHVVVDTIPPELTITTPFNNTFVKGDLDISWQCSDSNGIVRSEIKFDAWGWQDVTGTTYPASLADGQHTVQIRVTDAAGNQATRIASFTADSTPPELTIIGPPQDSYTQSSGVSWQASDNIGLDPECQLVFDNSGMVVVNMSASSTYYLHYFEHFQDGPHTVQLWVRDFANNWAMKTVNFTLDTHAPDLTVSSPVKDSTIRGNYVSLTWQASDNIALKEVRVWIDGEGGGVVEGNELKDIRLANGPHTIEVEAYDYAGNSNGLERTFTVNSQALSFSGPYYGTPLVAIIAAVLLVALFVVLRYVMKRKSAPPASPAEPPSEKT